MSQEDRSLNPGEILQGIGEMLDGDGVGDLPEALEQGPGYPYGGAPAAPSGVPGQAPWQWQQAPYAPPFNIPTGGSYPQMYQIPWSQFPGFPYRPEEFAQMPDIGEGVSAEQGREMNWGDDGSLEQYPYPYHHPHPYYHPYHHYHYHQYPRPYGYPPYPVGQPFPYRQQEGTDESNQQEQREGSETAVANPEDSRFFPGFGFGAFPGFGFGFPGFGFGGFPFFRPFPFFGFRPWGWGWGWGRRWWW